MSRTPHRSKAPLVSKYSFRVRVRVRDDDEFIIEVLAELRFDHLGRAEMMDRDADVVMKNVNAMLAGPVVRAVAKNTLLIHPDGVVVNDAAIRLATIHLKLAVWSSLGVLLDRMDGDDANGAVVLPIVVPSTQTPFNVMIVAGGMPGTVGGHGCSHCWER